MAETAPLALPAEVAEQVGALRDSIERLLVKAEASPGALKGLPAAVIPKELDAPPPRVAENLHVFCEFEACACTIDTEAVLLSGSDLSSREARWAALSRLQLPWAEAVSRLDSAGAALADGFTEFAEYCCMRDVSLHVLSRGYKEVVRHYLRSAGLGHVQARPWSPPLIAATRRKVMKPCVFGVRPIPRPRSCMRTAQ